MKDMKTGPPMLAPSNNPGIGAIGSLKQVPCCSGEYPSGVESGEVVWTLLYVRRQSVAQVFVHLAC